MGYYLVSVALLYFIYLLKHSLPKQQVDLSYFKSDLTMLDEDNISTL